MFKNACVWCEKGGGASSAMNNDNVFVEDSNGSQSPRDDSEELLMSPGGYIAAAVALFTIGFFGFFCNLAVIILMLREKQLWTPLNVILFNLVCSDFSVSVLGNPLTLTSALAHRWIFGRTMCVMYGFFMSLLGIASITTLTVLSFERYIMISRPFHKGHLNNSGAVGLVLGIWLYSLCLTVPPLVGWGDYVNEAANISCSVNWESKTYNATTYILFLFAMGLVVPIAVISFSYLNIIRTLRKNTLRMGRVTKAESRVAFMVAVMILAFLIAWTPYSILALMIAFGDPHLVSPGLAVVPALVAKSSICYNPLIYVGLNTQFRSAWHRLLGVHVNSEESRELGCNNTFGTPSRNFSQSATQDITPNDDRFRRSNHHKLLTFLSNNRGRSPKISSVLEVTSTQIHQNTTTSASSISKRSTSFRISEELVPKEKHDNKRKMKTETKVTLNEDDDRGNVEELELKELDGYVHKPKEGRENLSRHSL